MMAKPYLVCKGVLLPGYYSIKDKSSAVLSQRELIARESNAGQGTN
jgi:hypothetical protein